MLQVVGEIDRRHPALTELTIDAVTVFQSRVEAGHRIGHHALIFLGVGRARSRARHLVVLMGRFSIRMDTWLTVKDDECGSQKEGGGTSAAWGNEPFGSRPEPGTYLIASILLSPPGEIPEGRADALPMG
jgi:hypothetical protein